MRESQARILACPECGAEPDKCCRLKSGKSRSTAHAARVAAVAKFINDAYCENEQQYAPCGRPECPNCGGASRAGRIDAQALVLALLAVVGFIVVHWMAWH